MGVLNDVFKEIDDWFERALAKRRLIRFSPELITEEVALKLKVDGLTDNDLREITTRLEEMYDTDSFLPIVERHHFQYESIILDKEIGFDRYFFEHYEYEDGILTIVTGFEYKYWLSCDDYLTELNEDEYNQAIDDCLKGKFYNVI